MEKYRYNKDEYEKHPEGGPKNTVLPLKPVDVSVFENFDLSDPRFLAWLRSLPENTDEAFPALLKAYRILAKVKAE